jgi:hypothetical protein
MESNEPTVIPRNQGNEVLADASPSDRVQKLKTLLEGEPDAFFILVGAMKYNSQKGRYENGAFGDQDENSKLSTGKALATGGKDRMLATAELHLAYPGAFIVPMSKTRDDAKPTYAAVTREELLRKGVDESIIILEEESVSTITEYKEAIKIVLEKGWKNIVFVTSDWHLPRVKALFNHIENFADSDQEKEMMTTFAQMVREGKIQPQFLGSTDPLEIRSNHYKRLFDALDEFPGIQERIKTEMDAIEQIKSGTYAGRDIPKKIYEDQD